MQIRDAMEKLVESFPVPEQELEALYLDQESEGKNSVFVNILFFFIGVSLLAVGVYKTYLFTSQEDPHGAVRERVSE